MSFLKGLVIVQAFVVLMGSLSCYTDIHEAAIPRLSAPSPSPSRSPSPSPSLLPPQVRSLVAVEGVIYCKSCKFIGVNTLLGASPLSGATATLRCNNSRREITAEGKTDKNGYFFIHPDGNVTSFGIHKCKVFLGTSPLAYCKNPTDLNGGLTGANVSFHKLLMEPTPKPMAVYSTNPLAFTPPNATACPRSP